MEMEDDILDIDEVLSESFCCSSEDVNDDIESILQQWKQHEPTTSHSNTFSKNLKHVDTRTFTRPKKRIIRNIDSSMYQSSSSETDKMPTVNLQIGGLVTSSMGTSFLENVSPPSSTDSFELNSQMANSLITSNDFANVSSFINDTNSSCFNGINFDINAICEENLLLSKTIAINNDTASAATKERDQMLMNQISMDNHEWDKLVLDNMTLVQSFCETPPVPSSVNQNLTHSIHMPSSNNYTELIENDTDKTFVNHINRTFDKNVAHQQMRKSSGRIFDGGAIIEDDEQGKNCTFQFNSSSGAINRTLPIQSNFNRTMPVISDRNTTKTLKNSSIGGSQELNTLTIELNDNNDEMAQELNNSFEFHNIENMIPKHPIFNKSNDDPVNQSTPVRQSIGKLFDCEFIRNISPILENNLPTKTAHTTDNDVAKRFSQIIIDNKDIDDLDQQELSSSPVKLRSNETISIANAIDSDSNNLPTKYYRDSVNERLSLKTFEDFEKSISAALDDDCDQNAAAACSKNNHISSDRSNVIVNHLTTNDVMIDDQEFDKILNDFDNQKYHEYEDKMRMSLDNIKKKHLQDTLDKSQLLLHKNDGLINHTLTPSSSTIVIDSNKLTDSMDKLTGSTTMSTSSNERLLRRSRVFDNVPPLSTSSLHKSSLLNDDQHETNRLNDTVNSREKLNNRRSLCMTNNGAAEDNNVPSNDIDSNKLNNDFKEKTPRRLHRRSQLHNELQQNAIESDKTNYDAGYNPRDRYKTISLSRNTTQLSQPIVSISNDNDDNNDDDDDKIEPESVLPEYLSNETAQFSVHNTNSPIKQQIQKPSVITKSNENLLKRTDRIIQPTSSITSSSSSVSSSTSSVALKYGGGEIGGGGKTSKLHMMNENLKNKLSMKTSSVDSLNTRFGANDVKSTLSKQSSSKLNIAQPHKSSSSGNIILPTRKQSSSQEKLLEKGTTFKMPAPITAVTKNAIAPAAVSGVQLRNVKRSGLIRPSSGYYSNIKRTDFGLESGKCSSSNSLSSCSSNGSINKQTIEPKSYVQIPNGAVKQKPLNLGHTNDAKTLTKQPNSMQPVYHQQVQKQLSQQRASSTTNINKPEIPKPAMKFNSTSNNNNKRSGLPRPMSMANR